LDKSHPLNNKGGIKMVLLNILDQILRQLDEFLADDAPSNKAQSRWKWRRSVAKIYRNLQKKSRKNLLKLHVYIQKLLQLKMLNKSYLGSGPDSGDIGNEAVSAGQLTVPSIATRGIKMEDIQLDRIIGSGGFGTVFQGRMGTWDVAVKKMHLISKNKRARKESYRAELNALHLKHEHIVQTLAAYELDGQTVIIMEYAGELNLQQILNEATEGLESERRLRYALQIAKALRFAHENYLVHLDIKPANVMITSQDQCKLGDFGCCLKIDKKTGLVNYNHRSLLTGTFAYRAPELLKGEVPTSKADVYSYGITLWQMVSREHPYGTENQHVVIFGVVAYNLRPSAGRLACPSTKDDPFEICFRDLYTQCWTTDAEERPTSKELVEILDIWKEFYHS
jgi:proto-oncogene serine/threonine-protein kinase mos